MREITKGLGLIYVDVPVLRPGTVGAYLLAFVSVGLAAVLRVAIDPYVDGVQFITFFPAVIITTLISGLVFRLAQRCCGRVFRVATPLVILR